MLQWLGYKLPNSGVHDLGLAPRVWLITDCNHCEVTLILQRSPIICDWSNILSLRYEICYSQHILVKFSLFMFVHTLNESRKNQTDQLHFYKFLNFNTKAYDWLIYNYINFLCFFISWSWSHFERFVLGVLCKKRSKMLKIISDRNTQLLFGSFRI